MQDTDYEDAWLGGEDRPIGDAVEAARQEMKDEQINAFIDAARELEGKEPIKRDADKDDGKKAGDEDGKKGDE